MWSLIGKPVVPYITPMWDDILSLKSGQARLKLAHSFKTWLFAAGVSRQGWGVYSLI